MYHIPGIYSLKTWKLSKFLRLYHIHEVFTEITDKIFYKAWVEPFKPERGTVHCDYLYFKDNYLDLIYYSAPLARLLLRISTEQTRFLEAFNTHYFSNNKFIVLITDKNKHTSSIN